MYGTCGAGYCKSHYYEFVKKPYQRDYVKKWNQEKRETDLNFRIACNLRSRLYATVKGIHLDTTTVERLGCTLDEFRARLEKKFLPGMTWENYGKWHIDHIKPLSTFDLSNTKEIAMACHYTNLQPLWATDNLRKGNRYVG